jgi:hypothetical protein
VSGRVTFWALATFSEDVVTFAPESIALIAERSEGRLGAIEINAAATSGCGRRSACECRGNDLVAAAVINTGDRQLHRLIEHITGAVRSWPRRADMPDPVIVERQPVAVMESPLVERSARGRAWVEIALNNRGGVYDDVGFVHGDGPFERGAVEAAGVELASGLGRLC